MRVGELWQKIERYAARLPTPAGKRPSLSAVLRSRPSTEISEGIKSLISAYKTRRSTERAPSLSQLEALVKPNRHLTLVEFLGEEKQPRLVDPVAEYSARIKRILDGNGQGFFDVLHEMDCDSRVGVAEIRGITSTVLGISTSKLSGKAARAALVEEFATLGVGRVSTDAARRSRPY